MIFRLPLMISRQFLKNPTIPLEDIVKLDAKMLQITRGAKRRHIWPPQGPYMTWS